MASYSSASRTISTLLTCGRNKDRGEPFAATSRKSAIIKGW
jgi:hypothetical protein